MAYLVFVPAIQLLTPCTLSRLKLELKVEPLISYSTSMVTGLPALSQRKLTWKSALGVRSR